MFLVLPLVSDLQREGIYEEFVSMRMTQQLKDLYMRAFDLAVVCDFLMYSP